MSDTEEDSLSSDSWPVNEDWLLGIIKKYHNSQSAIKVTDFKVTPGSHDGVSNLSDILSVVVEYQLVDDPVESSKLEIIIKLLPQDPFSRFFVTEAKFDLREIQFYTRVLPDMLAFQQKHLRDGEAPIRVSVPKCLHSHYVSGRYRVSDGHVHQHEEDLSNTSPEPPESILVLQDMRPFGYRAAHFIKGLTFAETEAAIRALANVHALSLAMKSVEKLDLNEEYPFLFQVSKATDSYQQLVEQGLPQLTKFLEEQKGYEEIVEILRGYRAKTRYMIEHLLEPEEPLGLMTHTDFWCNNLLFHKEKLEKKEEDSCVILDWQMITYSRPTNDVALLIVSSLPSDIRRKNSGQLLDIYYESLKSNCLKLGVNIEQAGELSYSREALMSDFKKSQLLALLLCIGSVDVAIGNAEAEQRLLDVLQDFYNDGILTIDCGEAEEQTVE